MAQPSAAEVLIRAARAIKAWQGTTTIVKLGGSALEEPATARGTLQALATLQTLGVPLVVVHGGGKPIDRAMAEAGIEPVKIRGRRYTDDATLAVVVRVLSEINAGLVRDLQQLGAGACGFTDAETFPLRGERLMLPPIDLQPVDLGRVGKVTRVAGIPDRHYPIGITVLPSLAIDTDGGWLNVNADTAASAVAGHLKARRVLFLTDTPGVLANFPDPASLLPLLTRADCERLMGDGTVHGGMIPKVEACLEALDAGAAEAAILDGRDPLALLRALLGERFGTRVVAEVEASRER